MVSTVQETYNTGFQAMIMQAGWFRGQHWSSEGHQNCILGPIHAAPQQASLLDNNGLVTSTQSPTVSWHSNTQQAPLKPSDSLFLTRMQLDAEWTLWAQDGPLLWDGSSWKVSQSIVAILRREFSMGFAVCARSAGQKYGPTCHQRDRADVTEIVTLVRLSSLGQHVGVLALAGYKRRKSALTADPIACRLGGNTVAGPSDSFGWKIYGVCMECPWGISSIGAFPGTFSQGETAAACNWWK